MGSLGRAVQVEPIKPKLKPPGTKRLKLKCVILLSTSAFKFNLRRYISMSTLKPIMSTTVLGEKLSCLMFSETSPIIVAGGHGGIVGVFRLVGIERPVGDGNEPRRRLDEAMASDFSTA